ncbi:TIGR02996 domain-containing protein [Frigoriglobus tundricola]|uniref:TIGR02996 domain-containing protein n=1 Tax=Frigoriglobus tundricola TaxID=2774151 RepID=UPI00148EB2E4|nr:TIGR02996 domain-containing protein [Frigoriglobus tundricola]
MRTHPDADAFMRAYLEQPADATARRVFADWLEETGEPHSTAWAHYIRLKVEADRYAPNRPEQRLLSKRSEGYARQIRSRLVVSAKCVVHHHRALEQLLPLHRITVRLQNFRPDPRCLLLLLGHIARTNLALPIGLDDQGLILIVSDFSNSSKRFIMELKNLLCMPVFAVQGIREEIERAIAEVYPVPQSSRFSAALN